MRDYISFSEMSLYKTCSMKHKYVYVEEAEKIGSIHTAFGSAIHEACELALKENKDPMEKLEVFQEVFNKEVEQLRKQNVELFDSEVLEFASQADKILPHVLPAINSYFPGWELIEAEKELYEEIPDCSRKFKGFVDLIIKTPDGMYHVMDYKTCSWGWDEKKKSDTMKNYQLALYKQFVSQSMNIPLDNINVYFILLKRTATKNIVEIVPRVCGKTKVNNAVDMLRDTVEKIEIGIHMKNFNSCTMGSYKCEYYNRCYGNGK